MSTVHVPCADCQAEREAAALEWFNENLGQPEPVTRLRREREIKETAAELGIDPRPHVRYPRTAAVRRWLSVCDSVRDGKLITLRDRGFEPTTTAERRERIEANRRKKAAAVRAIAQLDARRPLTIQRAAELARVGLRTVERATSDGRLAVVRDSRDKRRLLVPVPSLRRFVSSRLIKTA